jgi:GTP:adenosylcobinamide-phosphate guanylyltransferase
MKVDVVVLAGGEGAIIDPTVSVKGLVPIAGKPMVEWVVDALRLSETVAEIAVVVPVDTDLGPWTAKVDYVVISQGKFIDNLLAGVDAIDSDRRVLIATGDVPALTADAVDDFVKRSIDRDAEVSYPLVRKADMVDQFPGSERTFVRIEGGPVTGGNMMLLTRDLVHRNRDIGQRLFETRKSPVRMARVIGVRFIVKLLVGRLNPVDVENKLGELLGGRCAAIYTEYASIGADVDKPIDVVVAERVLYERATGTATGALASA